MPRRIIINLIIKKQINKQFYRLYDNKEEIINPLQQQQIYIYNSSLLKHGKFLE